jgi:preprotein translocase subunit SecG
VINFTFFIVIVVVVFVAVVIVVLAVVEVSTRVPSMIFGMNGESVMMIPRRTARILKATWISFSRVANYDKIKLSWPRLFPELSELS